MALFKRSPLKATRLAQRKRRIFAFKTVGVVVVVGAIIGGLAWFSRLERFRITSVAVEGNTRVDASELQALVTKHLAGSYLYLFPRANRFMYPVQSITQDILSTYPVIKSVTPSTEGHALTITVTDRKPAYLWCKGDPTHPDTTSCYFMDDGGFVFSEAPHFSGDVYFTYYGILTADNPIGLAYVPQEFKGLSIFRTNLNQMGIRTYAGNAESDGVRELYLERGGKIIFKNTQEISKLVSLIDLIRSKTSLFKAQSLPLNYLDLRFGNKIYYTFTGDTTRSGSSTVDNPIQSN